MSSSPLVLITGGNGFVGYAVIVGALKAGYHVRAAVRRPDAIDTISRGPSVQPYLSSGALTFILVPNNALPGAYRSAAQSCSHIIHIASPIATQPGDLVSAALAGNVAILDAAEHTPSVRRVVITASTAGLRTFDRMFVTHPLNRALIAGGSEADAVPILTADTRVPTPPTLADDALAFERYVASKVSATNLVDAYVADHAESHFSIVNLMPGWILGPDELARNKAEAFKGSNNVLGWLFAEVSLAPFLGLPVGADAPLLGETVHLDDVVEAHVRALDTERVPGAYRNFLLACEGPGGSVIEDAEAIVRRELSEEVEKGMIPFKGSIGTIPSKHDARSTEQELLGHTLLPYERQVTDVIKWFLHLED